MPATEPAPNHRPKRGIGVWIAATYLVINGLLGWLGLAVMIATDDLLRGLPLQERAYIYLWPGVALAAGAALFVRSRAAFPLCALYLLSLLAIPAVMSTLYSDPFLGFSWAGNYARAASGSVIGGCLCAGAVTAYAGWLHARRKLP